MKYIELHDERDTFWVNTDSIGMIERATITTTPLRSRISSYIYVHGLGHYFIETVEEILQKIAEATQSERVEIFQKFAEAEQCERSFMNEWKNDVDDQLSRLKAKKGRCD